MMKNFTSLLPNFVLLFADDLARGSVSSHEPLNTLFGTVARLAAHAQVEHEARVVRGQAAEFGCRHLVLAEKFLDGTDQHVGLP